MMATRVANIRANLREEVNLARQALREKEKLAEMGVQTDVAAARRAFQQRVELARATASEEIKQARRATAEVATAVASAGGAATRAHGGFGRLSQEMVTVVRQMTGLPPVVAQAGGALGQFAIGAGPMLLVLAGLAALAKAIEKITEKSREAKKKIEEMRDAAKDISESRRQSPEATAFLSTVQAGKDLEKAKAKLADLKSPDQEFNQGQAKRIRDAEAEVARLQRIWDDGIGNIGDIATKTFEVVARDNETAANEAAAAWKKAVSEIEEEVKRLHSTWEGVELPPIFKAVLNPNETEARFNQARGKKNLSPLDVDVANADKLGFNITALQTLGATSNDAAEQIKRLQDAAHGTATAMAGGGTGTTPKPGLLDPFRKNLKDLLNPSAILNNALGGLATGGLNFALGLATKGITSVVSKLFGLGKAAEEAARAQRDLTVANIRAATAGLNGDDSAEQLLTLKQGVVDRLKDLGVKGPEFFKRIMDATSLEDLKKFLEQVAEAGDPNVKLVLDWLTASMKNLGETVNSVTESLRNVPAGFKIAQARFNATVGIASPSRVGAGTATGGAQGNIIFQAGAIVQQPGEDGPALARRVASEVHRSRLRGGTGDLDLVKAS